MKATHLTAAGLIWATPAQSVAQATRLMTPQDLFRHEVVGAVTWSPDGALAAVEISREADLLNLRPTTIWVADATTRALRRLSDRPGARLRFWNPIWAPNGKRLAFLSVDKEGTVHPWIWSRGTSRPVEIHDVDIQVNLGGDPPLAWLTNDTLLVLAWQPTAQKGQPLQVDVLRSRYAPELWSRGRALREPSVTVLESGGPQRSHPAAQVLAIAAATGRHRKVAEGPIHRIAPSPNGRYLAFFSASPGVPSQPVASFWEHQELYSSVNLGFELHVVDAQTGRDLATPINVLDPDYGSLKWSRGGQLLLLGRMRGDTTGPGVIVFRDARFQSVGAPLRNPTAATWLGERAVVSARASGANRGDWFLLGDGPPAALTSSLGTPPAALYALSDDALLGVADGELWHFSSAAPPSKPRGSQLSGITEFRAIGPGQQTYYAVASGKPSLLRVRGETLSVVPLPSPHADARLRAISPNGIAIHFASTQDGSRLWLAAPEDSVGTWTTLWWGNRWLVEVRRGKAQHFTYASQDGKPLHGWVLLPSGETGARPLPVVTIVYPGAVYGTRSPFVLSPIDYFEPELFAALGYAVLLPSMPSEGETGPVNAIDELMNGVIPAIDTLVRRGTADSARIAVGGYSAGGYATLGLITQTSRFRAAIAVASYANLVSLYGTFYGQYRYGDAGHPQHAQVLRMMQMERGFMNMGAPPWRDRERYLHNSPLFGVDRVTTPVMLVHGDMDFIPIEQAEEFFTALYRQDKRVQFVRYHGEGHGPTSRPNVVDLWKRIDAWLSEQLRR